jgi:hypothetical protein
MEGSVCCETNQFIPRKYKCGLLIEIIVFNVCYYAWGCFEGLGQ